MGAHHSSPSDKKAHAAGAGVERNCDSDGDSFKSSASLCPSVSTVLCNTPYLTVMFERLAEESVSIDPSVKSGTVSRHVFEKTFNGPLKLLGKLLFDYMCREQVDGGVGSSCSSSNNGGGGGGGGGCSSSSSQASSLADSARAAPAAEAAVDCRCFLRIATEVLSLINVQQQISYYFNVFACAPRVGLTADEVRQLVMCSFSVALTGAYLPYEPTEMDSRVLDAFTSSLFTGASSSSTVGDTEQAVVRLESFASWCSRHCQNLFNGVHCFLVMKLSGGSNSSEDGWHKRMLQEGPAASTTAESAAPAAGGGVGVPHSQSTASMQATPLEAALGALDGGSSSSTLCLSVVWLLSCSLPSKYIVPPAGNQQPGGGTGRAVGITAPDAFMPHFLVSKLHQIVEHNAWSLLYNSDQHGLSTNRFETYAFSYKGPSVTLITFDSHIYVVGNDDEWRESLQRWGGDDCILLQILPRFGVVQAGSDLMYVNHHNRGACKGIQIGKDARHIVLQIDDMTTVKYYGTDLTLEHLEVWGCAGAEATEQQTRQRQWDNKEAEKLSNRKLKFESWEENPDRQLLSWAGINTNHAQKA